VVSHRRVHDFQSSHVRAVVDIIHVVDLRREQPLEILDGIPGQAVAQAGRVADVVAVV
jgi:hypothetical protein